MEMKIILKEKSTTLDGQCKIQQLSLCYRHGRLVGFLTHFNQGKMMILVVDPILGVTFEQLEEGCKNKCGEHNNDICFCDEQCVVYRTCCEDFEKSCPNVFREGIKKYQKLSQLELYCTHYDVLMVASCPIISENATNPIRKDGSKRNKTDKSFFTHESFHTILENRPVTNVETGIVFTNKTIYDCNNKKNSNFTFWKPYFANLALNFSFMREEKRALDFIAYQTPNKIFEHTFCSNTAVNSCNDTNIVLPLDEHKFFVNKCTSFRSYLKIVCQISEYKTYQNRYCLVCNEGYGDFQLFNKKFHTAQLQILFNMDVNSTVRLTAKNSPATQDWQEATCKLDDLKLLNDVTDLQHTPCKIQKCSPDFFQSPDTKCHRIWLIGMVNTVGSFVWWEHKKINVSDVLACLLKEVLHFQIYKFSDKQYNIYDLETKENVALELMQVYSLKNAINYDKNVQDPDINKSIKINLVTISSVIHKYHNDSGVSNAFNYQVWLTERQLFEDKANRIAQNLQMNGIFVFNTSVTVCIMNDMFRNSFRLYTSRIEHNIQPEIEGVETVLQSKCLVTNKSRGLELITSKIASTLFVVFCWAIFD